MLDVVESSIGAHSPNLDTIMISLGSFVILISIHIIFKRYISKYLQLLTKGKKNTLIIKIIRLLKNIPPYFFIGMTVIIPLWVLHIHPQFDFILQIGFWALFVIQFVRISTKILLYVIEHIISPDGKVDDATRNITDIIVHILVWTTGILLLLMNIGVQITPLLASLGIGGIAIAFALQNILQDIFGSFSIFIDKPFTPGDFIVVGDNRGTVKKISLKATYISSIQGHEIVIPNKEMMSSVILNYAHMKRRGKVFTIGVLYETAISQLEQIPHLVEQSISTVEHATFGRTHIQNLSAYSIDIEIGYFIEGNAYILYLDVHQKIILAILRTFAEQGIRIAYPTQLLYTQSIEKQ